MYSIFHLTLSTHSIHEQTAFHQTAVSVITEVYFTKKRWCYTVRVPVGFKANENAPIFFLLLEIKLVTFKSQEILSQPFFSKVLLYRSCFFLGFGTT